MKTVTIRSTTILGVRVGKKIALGGDGQVTMGDMQMKSKAVKVRSFCNGKILAGFAGAAADAMALFEKFEGIRMTRHLCFLNTSERCFPFIWSYVMVVA